MGWLDADRKAADVDRKKLEAQIERGLVFARYPQDVIGKLKTSIFGILLFPPRLVVLITSGVVGFSSFFVLNGLGLKRTALSLLRLQARIWFGSQENSTVPSSTTGSNMVVVSRGLVEEERHLTQGAPVPAKCVLISNHIGIHEIFWFVVKYSPGFVSKAEVRKAPIIGKIGEMLNCVFVDRKTEKKGENVEGKPKQKMNAVESIKEKFNSSSSFHLCAFPEGTTTNGEQLIRFRSGAFVPMLPVLPHLVKFGGFQRGRDFDPHYTAVKFSRWIIGLMCQGWIRFQVTYLPLQTPKDGETPREYADRIQKLMASEANMPCVDRSFSDKKIFENKIRDGFLSERTLYSIQADRLTQRGLLDEKSAKKLS
eukprot:CAMPEP_0114533212 /NCGR_PEP_ID=MMETSP0109-20121206/27119_1 /TAXON_ID=29199 /ORGANISM="Chlorarachnion reptans, Strain CCCM449" /LENGTH=367 /DNA_ID=CAMNT_0001716409 /DNA_START=245 /DNA_END=1349 /DNA_ORIENTATION=-